MAPKRLTVEQVLEITADCQQQRKAVADDTEHLRSCIRNYMLSNGLKTFKTEDGTIVAKFLPGRRIMQRCDRPGFFRIVRLEPWLKIEDKRKAPPRIEPIAQNLPVVDGAATNGQP